MNYALFFALFVVVLACYFGGLALCTILPAPRLPVASLILLALYVVGFGSLAGMGSLALQILGGTK